MQMAIIDPTPALKHVAASYPLHTRSLTFPTSGGYGVSRHFKQYLGYIVATPH
jgi:hypothetical protein